MVGFFFFLILFSCILMLICVNPINSVLFLILIFLSASNIFLLLGCDFLGLIFIVVYLGAIAVLFLFIVMMVNIKKMEGDNTTYLLIGVLFFLIFFFQLFFFVSLFFEYDIFNSFSLSKNSFFFYGENKLDMGYKKSYFFNLGKILYLDFFFYLVIISILLLVGMVGSIFLTNYKNNFSSRKQYNQLNRNNKLLNLHIL